MNQMDLKCRMVDHFDANKTIEGVCMDDRCTSPQRLWCIMCLKKYHSKCSRDSYLTKEEIEEELKLKLTNLKKYSQSPQLEVFMKLKDQLIKQLDLLEKSMKKQSGSQYQAQIEKIEEILRNPHSTKILTDSYDLLSIQVNSQQDVKQSPIIERLAEILEQVKSLDQFSSQRLLKSIVPKHQDYFIKDQTLVIKMPSLIYSLDFSPDDRFICCASTDKIIIYDLQWSKQFGPTLFGHTRDIYCVRYSRCGKYLISGSEDASARIWDAAACKQIGILKGHEGEVKSVGFSPDGVKMITGGDDHTIRIWNFSNFIEQVKILGHKESVYSVEYSPCGKYFVSSSQDNSIRVWYVKTLEQVKQLRGHRDTPTSIRYSKDGLKIVSGSNDKSVRIWDLKTETQIVLGQTGHKVLSVAFSPDSKFIISSGQDKTLQLWCAKTGNLLETLEGHTDYIWSVKFSHDGKYVLSGSGDKTIRRTPFLPQ